MEQVFTIDKECLEGPVNEALNQEFSKQEAMSQKQVEAARGFRSRET
jgi:uncharacterized protein YggU (UPF0235/DUF167 family)